MKINVPIDAAVRDDDTDPGPLRLALVGTIVEAGMIAGGRSSLIRSDNPAMTPEWFTWSAAQR